MRLYEYNSNMASIEHAPVQKPNLVLILNLPHKISATNLLSSCRAFFFLCPIFTLNP
jgi:hypothetical protein